ncbi:MAG: hypothetical protein HFH48_02370 [Lachnospiraceae bacterium]|nr:hypothetical protein [Dorea sp.]MCI9136397.1 hypothetical protein [Lachnospiraceae bacterium]
MLPITSGCNVREVIMSNPVKDIFDQESIMKDIAERENIICNYKKSGLLDRDHAIKKIQELRISDEDIAVATSVKLAISSISFNQATNAQIVGELIMQRDILQAKLTKNRWRRRNEYEYIKTKT